MFWYLCIRQSSYLSQYSQSGCVQENPHQSAQPEISAAFLTFQIAQLTFFVLCRPQVSSIYGVPTGHWEKRDQSQFLGWPPKDLASWMLHPTQVFLPLILRLTGREC